MVFPRWAVEQVLLYQHHEHLAVSRFVVHWRYCSVLTSAGRSARRATYWPMPVSSPASTRGFRLCLVLPGNLCVGLPSIWISHASPTVPVRVAEPFHSMGVCFVRCQLGHSPAFSFPTTPLWQGHQRIPMAMPGSFYRSLVM